VRDEPERMRKNARVFAKKSVRERGTERDFVFVRAGLDVCQHGRMPGDECRESSAVPD